MASIADGTYIIVSALNTGCAIDSRGASDANGSNVWLYTKGGSDAQFIHVTTNTDGSRRLIFSLTGKSVDIAAGTIADGTNVQQYSDNASHAQKWIITDSGATIAINQTTYNLFTVSVFISSGYCLDVTAGQGVSGTNVQIYTANSSAAQRWAFIPADPVPQGTYMIRSALDTNAVLDVAAGSLASGANVQIYGVNETNAQIWRVRNYDSSGLASIYNANSGLALNVYGKQTTDGTNVQQWTDDGTDANKWLFEPVGTMLINGVTVPTYRIRFLTGSGKVLDCAYGKTTPKTNVQIWTSNGTKAQIWAFQPFSMLVGTLPVPASVHAALTADTDKSGPTVDANNAAIIYPSFACSGTDYQVRYRERVRKTGKSIGDWGSWHSIADGTTANNGWGDTGTANCITENSARKYMPEGVSITPVDNVVIDYSEIQIETRRFEADYDNTAGLYAHGNSNTALFRMAWKPTLTITSVEFSPSGISIAYSSDYKRDGNTITIRNIASGINNLCKGYTFTSCPCSGTITVPISALEYIPDDGAQIITYAEIMTDATYSKGFLASTISYNVNRGISVTPTYTYNDDYTVTANITASKSDHCYLLINGKLTECKGSSGKFAVIPPFNAEYKIMVTSSDGSKWGMHTDSGEVLDFKGFAWNWDDKCALIKYNKDSSPVFTDDQSTDSEEKITTGRQYPVYRFGGSIVRKLNVEGVYTDTVLHGTSKDINALCTANHATFRDPAGNIKNVAILEVSKKSEGTFRSQLGDWGTVTVDQREETL